MVTVPGMKPLFIPLRGVEFDAFANGRKRVEYRRYGRQFTERQAYPGRSVTLSRGYSGARLYGVVLDVGLMYAAPGCGLDTYGPDAEIIAITIGELHR